jgi:hypothetical protein
VSTSERENPWPALPGGSPPSAPEPTGPRFTPARSLVDDIRRATGAGGTVLGRVPPPTRPWTFAVEDTTVQITWAALGPGPVVFRCADTVVEVAADGGPGAVVLAGLPPGRPLTVELRGEGLVTALPRQGRPDTPPAVRPVPRSWRRLRVHTLTPPPGEELFRFATISDLHVGAESFGLRDTMTEVPQPPDAHPVRATRAALAELTTWGARLVLIKGDLTHRGRTAEWEAVGGLLKEAAIPVEMLPGNHDHYGRRADPDPYDALAHLGHDMTRHVSSHDVPGLRIVLFDSTDAPRGGGHVRHHTEAALAELRDAGTPAFLTMHHYAQRLPFPTFWPPGIPSPEANAFVEAVAATRPATMISSGHTHRHRRRHIGPLVWTEVGSPKDFPGTWAGYVVHEGGIRQVVRRVAEPDVMAWTDYSARAVLGAWGLWSCGVLAHRCFAHAWPAGRPGPTRR